MTSDALRPARHLYQDHILEFIALVVLSLCLPWSTACTAAHSAGVSDASTANPHLSGNLSAASVGVPYNGTISVSGGKGAYVFSLSTGSLPSGLILSQASGTISGTPAKTGMSSFTVQATDSTGVQALQSFQISVATSATVALQVAPAVTTVTSSGTMQFVSVVTNTSNTTVTWSASVGSVSSSGVYQAPAVTAKTA